MLDTLYNYLNLSSNYSITNTNNIYNAILCIMEDKTEEENRKILKIIKIQIGITFYSGFSDYIYKKIPESNLLKLF